MIEKIFKVVLFMNVSNVIFKEFPMVWVYLGTDRLKTEIFNNIIENTEVAYIVKIGKALTDENENGGKNLTPGELEKEIKNECINGVKNTINDMLGDLNYGCMGGLIYGYEIEKFFNEYRAEILDTFKHCLHEYDSNELNSHFFEYFINDLTLSKIDTQKEILTFVYSEILNTILSYMD